MSDRIQFDGSIFADFLAILRPNNKDGAPFQPAHKKDYCLMETTARSKIVSDFVYASIDELDNREFIHPESFEIFDRIPDDVIQTIRECKLKEYEYNRKLDEAIERDRALETESEEDTLFKIQGIECWLNERIKEAMEHFCEDDYQIKAAELERQAKKAKELALENGNLDLLFDFAELIHCALHIKQEKILTDALANLDRQLH